MIGREQIQKRLAELLESKERLLADLNALLGMIEENQRWLGVLDGAPPETPGETGAERTTP